MKRWSGIGLAGIAMPLVFAQAPTPQEPEVRRALPVDAPHSSDNTGNYENPGWVKQPPAAPTASDTNPQLTPNPTPAERIEEESISSSDNVENTLPAPTPQPTIDPIEQASRVLNLANSLYARKMYDLAIPEYEKFLISPYAKDSRDAALFRLAECHRILGNNSAARAGYEKLVMEFQKGEFAGAGACRLGEFLFSEKNYEAAHAQYETAAREARDEKVRLAAKYFSARSLDNLQRNAEAKAAYQAVVETTGDNPYRDHALMALADIAMREGKKEESFAMFNDLADSSHAKPEMIAEAAVKAAALAAELGKKDKALVLFNNVIKMSDVPDWKPAALIGAMRVRYQSGDYRGVVEMGLNTIKEVPVGARPEALQLYAASQRQLGNNLEARRTYDLLLRDFPDSPLSESARFQRLVCLYALKAKKLVPEIDAFLENSTDPKERTQAFLLKAEALFKQGDYAEAGKIYQSLLSKDLEDALRANALYKLGWCLGAVQNYPEAISAYSQFLDQYPGHALAPTALAQRALAKQQNKEFESAIEDFDLLISKYPKGKEYELALQQKALIYGQQQKYDEMSKTFNQLLDEFPKSAAAAQANFWLGWAAFEKKDYKASIDLLSKARELDPDQYRERASLRIILACYYLKDLETALSEISKYKGENLPPEIPLWLAMQMVEKGDDARVESLLLPLVRNPAAMTPEAWIQLAEAQIHLEKFREARSAVEKFLETAHDPETRARALLASIRINLGTKNFSEASRLIDETLLLQPEGRLNAEARLLSGDLLAAQSDFDGAARAYMAVSVLIDDPDITPRALQLAANAYRRANNTAESKKALTELQQRFPHFQKTTKLPKDNI